MTNAILCLSGLLLLLGGGPVVCEDVTEKEYPEGLYTGETNEEGERHGHGILVWKNGDRHEGEFRNDRPNGPGKYYYKNGEIIILLCFIPRGRSKGISILRLSTCKGQFSNEH